MCQQQLLLTRLEVDVLGQVKCQEVCGGCPVMSQYRSQFRQCQLWVVTCSNNGLDTKPSQGQDLSKGAIVGDGVIVDDMVSNQSLDISRLTAC